MPNSSSERKSKEHSRKSVDMDKKSFVQPLIEKHGDIQHITRGPAGGTADILFGGTGGLESPGGS